MGRTSLTKRVRADGILLTKVGANAAPRLGRATPANFDEQALVSKAQNREPATLVMLLSAGH